MLSLQVNASVLPPYLGYVGISAATPPDYPQRLAEFRKRNSLTQAQVAEGIGTDVVQLRSYEAGCSQPTLDVIRKNAVRRWQTDSNGGERK